MSSLSFSGTAQYARSGTAVVSAYPFTLSCWLYQTVGATASPIGVFNGTSGTSSAFMRINITSQTLGVCCDDGTTNTVATTTNAVTLSVWSHACGVYTSSTSRRAILDGSTAGATTSATSRNMGAGINRTSMGVRDNSAQSLLFTGQLANAAIWNAALSDAEVVALAAGFSPRKIQPHKLIFFAPYLGVGSTVDDWYGNDLTITGATTNANTPPKVGHP